MRRRELTAPIDTLDRLPPHSIESEQGVLGCILLDPPAGLIQVQSRWPDPTEPLYDLRHKVILESVIEMFSAGRMIDLITFQQFLKDKGQLEAVGGVTYLSGLQDVTPSAANIEYYIEIVEEKWKARRLIQIAVGCVARVYDGLEPVSALLDSSEREFQSIRNNLSAGSKPIRTLVHESISQIEAMHELRGKISGLPTGLADLDRLTDGLHGSELVMLAGFTSTGKTSLAMNIAENVAVNCEIPVGIFSLEMSARSLTTRMVCSRARVNTKHIRLDGMAERDFPKITLAAGAISRAPIHIDDSCGLTVFQFRAKARQMAQAHGIKLIVLDYIQLLSAAGSKKKTANRQEEVTEISREVKGTGRELDIPIIALSQLNHQGNLRESDSLSHDADSVWKIKVADETDEEKLSDHVLPVNLHVSKNRNGETGLIPLTFLKSIVRFESAAKVAEGDHRWSKMPYTD